MGGIPIHIAVIPDGNRRWARSKGLAPWQGHYHGRNNFRRISEAAFGKGIVYFSLFTASEANLVKRNPVEVRFLVALLKDELLGGAGKTLLENKIRLKVFGRWSEIIPDEKLARLISELQEKTASFGERQLTLLLGYDWKRELAEAARKLIESRPEANDVSYELIKSCAWTAELPPCDLVIRTGEEKSGWMHQSAGFLMFQTADSLFYSTKTFWPDFSEEEFTEVLKEYATIERRFGA